MELKDKILEAITKPLYQNSTDDSYTMQIRFEKIPIVTEQAAESIVKICNEEMFKSFQEGFNAATETLIGANEMIQKRTLNQ